MKQGFVKVAAVTPKIVVADTKENTALICAEIKKAEKEGAKIIVLPVSYTHLTLPTNREV